MTLIDKVLETCGHRPEVGRGGPLSPMLSNILLDDLDKELERRGLRFVPGTDAPRWSADDFMIFVKSQRSAQRVFASVQRYLTQQLKLVVRTAQDPSGISSSFMELSNWA